MIEPTTKTVIYKGFSLRPTAGNATALSECPPNAPATAPSSRKFLRHLCRTCENPLKVAQHARADRCQRRAQPPARNTNPHSARSTV